MNFIKTLEWLEFWEPKYQSIGSADPASGLCWVQGHGVEPVMIPVWAGTVW